MIVKTFCHEKQSVHVGQNHIFASIKYPDLFRLPRISWHFVFILMMQPPMAGGTHDRQYFACASCQPPTVNWQNRTFYEKQVLYRAIQESDSSMCDQLGLTADAIPWAATHFLVGKRVNRQFRVSNFASSLSTPADASVFLVLKTLLLCTRIFNPHH